MNLALEQDDYYDGYKNHATAETVQCRMCGGKFRTLNEMIAQFWVDCGCPNCQKRYTRIAIELLERGGFTDEYVENIFRTGLNV